MHLKWSTVRQIDGEMNALKGNCDMLVNILNNFIKPNTAE